MRIIHLRNIKVIPCGWHADAYVQFRDHLITIVSLRSYMGTASSISFIALLTLILCGIIYY